MKALIIILIVIVILGVALYFYFTNMVNNLDYTFSPDLTSLNLANLIGSGQSTTQININGTVTNKNNISFGVTNLQALIYYNGTLIAQTSDNLKNTPLNIQGNGAVTNFSDTITIFMNPQTIQILQSVLSKNAVVLNYTLKFSLYGIPLSYSSTYTYQP